MPQTLYDKSGNQIQVPDEKVQALLLSGEYGLPRGQGVPVNMDGQIGSVPLSQLRDAVAQGASVVSHEEYEKQALQNDYGDVAHGLEAYGLSTLDSIGVGLPGAAFGALAGKGAKEQVRNTLAANPGLATAGHITGAVAPIVADLATGGALTPLVAPELAGAARVAGEGAEALEGAAGAADAYRTAAAGAEAAAPAAQGGGVLSLGAKALAAPSSAVSRIGDAVEQGVHGLIGSDATSLLGRVAQQGTAQAARGAAENAIFNVGSDLSEEMLKDKPEVTAAKLFASAGKGVLEGGIFGGGLGTLGVVGNEVLGRMAPRLANKASDNLLHSIDPSGKLSESFTREESHVIRRKLIDDGVVKAGDRIQDIAPKIEKKLADSESKLSELYKDPKLNAPDIAGPKVSKIEELISSSLGEKGKFPSLETGGFDRDQLLRDVRGAAKMQDASGNWVSVPKTLSDVEGGLAGKMAEQSRLSFADVATLTDKLSQAAKNAEGKEREGLLTLAGKLEEHLEKNLPKGLEHADQLLEARSEVSTLRKLSDAAQVTASKAEKASDHGLLGMLGVHGGHGLGAIAAGLSLAGEHGLSALTHGAIAGIAQKLIAQRGRSTAAVLIDKLAAVGSARRAALSFDRRVNAQISTIADGGSRAAKVAEPMAYSQYKKAIAAWQDQAHQAAVAKATMHLASHAPKMAQAFASSANRSVGYLLKNFPQVQPDPSQLQPKLDKREPSDVQMARFDRIYRAVMTPDSILGRVTDGTITPEEVDAVKNTHPELYPEMCNKLQLEIAQSKKQLDPKVEAAAKLFLGVPQIDPQLTHVLSTMPGPAEPTGKGKGSKAPRAPKRELSLPAEVVGTSASRLQKALR